MTEKATFAGGCFWCMEPPYKELKGVSAVTSGYTGGKKTNPSYEDVCSGTTGHAEAVQIEFDPAIISYSDLVEIFWRNIDPTQINGQFYDHGSQYRTAIFYHDENQKKIAESSKAALAASGKFDGPIATEITPASVFYPAEEYHQDYYRKCPLPYQRYSAGSGRKAYIEKVWGKQEKRSVS